MNYKNIKTDSSNSVKSSRVLINNGVVNFESGELKSISVYVTDTYFKNIINNGEINITGTDVTARIENSVDSELLIESGTSSGGIYNEGTLTITGGKITNTVNNLNNMTIKAFAVIDTNVIVSALTSSLEESAVSKVADLIDSKTIIPLYDDRILSDWKDDLRRCKNAG